MATITVSMQFPEAMVPFIENDDQMHTFERNAMILYPFIQNLTISHGRAAEILGVHKFDLIDFYCSMRLPYLHQTIGDLEDELADMHSFEGAGA